jgi:hypothetical protein
MKWRGSQGHSLRVGFSVLLCCVLLLTCVARIVPFTPDMPTAGLDGSWRLGMEQAMAQGLRIGLDVIFTFGPYASVYTRNYHPDTDGLMLAASAYLAVSYALTVGTFVARSQRRWIVVLMVVLAGLVYLPDALLFFLPLLVGLQVYQLSDGSDLARRGRADIFWLTLLFAPLGLLPLIKGTLVLLCAAVVVCCSMFLLRQRRYCLAAVCVLVPLLSMTVFWLAAGQPLVTLPAYFAAMLPIVSGYTEAMGYTGAEHEPILVAMACVGLLWTIWCQPAVRQDGRYFLLVLFAVYLFVSFKAGFVRHDGHAVIAGTALLMAALALLMVMPSRRAVIAAGFSLFAWFVVDFHYQKSTPASLTRNLQSTFVTAWSGARQRLQHHDWPRSQFDATLSALRQQAGWPLLDGTTDVYAYDQSWLIASGNRWSPRPVLQSYSAYTPALAEANRKHLLGASAPDNIFFTIQSIDERWPSLDDGPSWPLLLQKYRPVGAVGTASILTKRQDVVAEVMRPASISAHRFGDAVALPQTTLLLFAQLDIQPTLAGRLAALMFRSSQLKIKVLLDDGTVKTYRMVSAMAQAGFLLSPLIEGGDEFRHLYTGQHFLDNKRVKSFSIDTDPRVRWFWQQSYTLRLTTLAIPDSGA